MKFTGQTHQEFIEFQGDDLFDIKNYFWEFFQDGIRRKHFIYLNPLATAPVSQVDAYDRYSDGIRHYLNFSSYNYLGYSVYPEVIKDVQETLAKYGTGAASAPLFSGYYDITKKLEDRIAAFKKKEAALVFPTGYSANVGVLSCILKPGDVAVLDILAHASIYDGARLAGATIKVFSHNNPRHLERVLKSLKTKRVIVCVEGVYSMDGDLVKLPEIVAVCKKYGAKILIDEAHATLIFGKEGRGVAEHFGLEDAIDISIGTFSKAFGAIGGFAVADHKLISFMRVSARSYIFSCAMAPHTAAGILKILEIYSKDKSQRDRLWENTKYMHAALRAAGLDIGETQSQVVPVFVGEEMRLREIGKRIYEKGLYTGIVTYPAVPTKRTRLRLSVSAYHTKEQMDACTAILKSAFDAVPE
ncbi:MAG: aminotransferase class I/II-fold pyridoxal phosphate-dependent enzyme [Deltaproteobacteria bacterium]|nr:aminotransferase class I/II-fold pyridoxal phosphate-dependent enzyme [Deltaproteobacteria bacterium]